MHGKKKHCLLIQSFVSFVRLAFLSFLLPIASGRSTPAFLRPKAGGVKETVLKMKGTSADAMAYNAFASASVDLSDPYVSHDNGMLSITRTVLDIDADAKRKYVYSIPIPKDDNNDSPTCSSSIPPQQVSSDVTATIPSPSGDKLAVFKKGNDDSKEQQLVEIWTHQCQCLSHRIVLPKSHGNVCQNSVWFGSPSWNAQETALVYSAERKEIETKSFFRKDEKGIAGGQHTLGVGKTESWGEKYSKMSALLDLYCLDVSTGNVGLVKNVPGSFSNTTTLNGYTLGQAVFSPCGTHIAYTAWDAGGGSNMPRRLGMIYCFQRPCQIYVSPVMNLLSFLAKPKNDEEEQPEDDLPCTCLTKDFRLARSPRFQPVEEPSGSSASKLAYLACEEGYDTHGGAVSLYMMDWKIEKYIGAPVMDSNCELVKMVDLPSFSTDQQADNVESVAGMTFPGLFLNQLPDSCFPPNNHEYILLNTKWGSVAKVVRVSLVDRKLTVLDLDIDQGTAKATAKENLASQSFLCFTRNGGAIVSESASNQPAVIGYVSPESMSSYSTLLRARLISNMSPIATSSVSSIDTVGKMKESFDYKVFSVPAPTLPGAAETRIQCILLTPTSASDKGKPPLLVVPHGGPHSSSVTTYIASYAFLCAHGGYAVLFVNYRGSDGFGMDALNSLPGNIGVVDVADVVQATRSVCDSGQVDASWVGICGGSHGGFLAGHLLGQYPNLFQAAAMRNPVTNIATMVSSTDIPDWCYVETFGHKGKYDWTNFSGPTAQQLEEMYRASPIAHVKNVVAPTLIAVGMSDKRVLPSQSLEYYHTLRSAGIKTKLLMYDEDDHAIDRSASQADHWINIKRWFDEHLRGGEC